MQTEKTMKEILEIANDPIRRRAEMMKDKQCAAWLIFLELRGMINPGKFSEEYFERVPAWFENRLKGRNEKREKTRFTAEEYDKIAASLRDLANRLNGYADELDAAEINPD